MRFPVTIWLLVFAIKKGSFPHVAHSFSIRNCNLSLPSSVLQRCQNNPQMSSALNAFTQGEKLRSSIPLSKRLKELHPLGPPQSLNSLQVGETSSAFTSCRYDTFGKINEFEVTRISDIPDMFLIRNFVSTMEQYTLLWKSRNHPTGPVFYMDDDKNNDRTHSCVNWMEPHDANGIPGNLIQFSESLLFSREMETGKERFCEPLQLVRYTKQGGFLMHHDENGRYMTVLYYLNGVAGTWFPLAGTSLDDESGDIPQNKEEALQKIQMEGLKPGKDGILIVGGKDADKYDSSSKNVVKVYPGDAVVFFNYDTTRKNVSSPEIDWRALHAGLPASEDKCIATHWFNGGDLLL